MNALTVRPGAGLFLLRAVVGVTFLAHGVDKLVHPSAAHDYFASLGIPVPVFVAPLVGATETLGGLLLITGLATRFAALGLATDMLVAFLTAHVGHGFFVEHGGAELDLAGAGHHEGGACAADDEAARRGRAAHPRRQERSASGDGRRSRPLLRRRARRPLPHPGRHRASRRPASSTG